jgi:tRNA-2-methylthio-N6-dimethylallyladenosine synthase
MYSPRPGTPAAERFPDQVPIEVRQQRLARLIEIQERIGLEANRALIGQTMEALVEGVAPRTPGGLLLRTRGDKMAVAQGTEQWLGRRVRIEIHDANGHTLLGRIVE